MADDSKKIEGAEKQVIFSEVQPETSPISLTTAALFLTGVTFASMMGGFGLSLGIARKKSPDAFVSRHNEGAKLALRALGYGSLLAMGGVGVIVFSVKTALGVNTAKEFGSKMQDLLPSKDGKFVAHFESWKLPRKKGLDDKEVESWFEEKPK